MVDYGKHKVTQTLEVGVVMLDGPVEDLAGIRDAASSGGSQGQAESQGAPPGDKNTLLDRCCGRQAVNGRLRKPHGPNSRP